MESQPYIGSTPAGNVLISAAILYAGALPSKVLHVMDILKCSTISRMTFFRHQRIFLQPALHSVWTHYQDRLVSTMREQGDDLVLAGDGRADSPGHSAKYGSYTLVELTTNKVIDFKLIQV